MEKIRWSVVLCVLLMGLVRGQGVGEDDPACEIEDAAELTPATVMPPFSIDTTSYEVDAGASIQVHLHASDSNNAFQRFILQSVSENPSEQNALGTWSLPEQSSVRQLSCRNGVVIRDTYASPAYSDVIVDWVATGALPTRVVFTATVAMNNTLYEEVYSESITITGNQAAEPVASVPLANEDPHDAKNEEKLAALAAQKKQEQIDEENLYSEGQWQIVLVEQEKAHEDMIQQEMREYEIMQQDQENARLDRIRMEIQDKEEHDALAWEQEQAQVEEVEEVEEEEDDDTLIDMGENGIIDPVLTQGVAINLLSLSLAMFAILALLL